MFEFVREEGEIKKLAFQMKFCVGDLWENTQEDKKNLTLLNKANLLNLKEATLAAVK